MSAATRRRRDIIMTRIREQGHVTVGDLARDTGRKATVKNLSQDLSKPYGFQGISVDSGGQMAQGVYSSKSPGTGHIGPDSMEAAVGFEPTDNGFANRRLGPLGYAALRDIRVLS